MNSSSDDLTPSQQPVAAETQHPDPLTGEPGAHPVGVGVGAIGAGIAGATIGAVAGPVGILIGAAIGAVAGGLAGKEVAEADDAPPVADEHASADPSAEALLPTEGMSGLGAGGAPAASMARFAGMAAPAAEEEVAGSSIADVPGTASAPFHDAFTATTFHEAVAESRVEDDADGPEDTIRTAAYFRYLDRKASGRVGDSTSDWIEAERELMQG